jgi:hypothetical protein
LAEGPVSRRFVTADTRHILRFAVHDRILQREDTGVLKVIIRRPAPRNLESRIGFVTVDGGARVFTRRCDDGVSGEGMGCAHLSLPDGTQHEGVEGGNWSFATALVGVIRALLRLSGEHWFSEDEIPASGTGQEGIGSAEVFGFQELEALRIPQGLGGGEVLPRNTNNRGEEDMLRVAGELCP